FTSATGTVKYPRSPAIVFLLFGPSAYLFALCGEPFASVNARAGKKLPAHPPAAPQGATCAPSIMHVKAGTVRRATGTIEASTTRRPSTSRTRQCSSTTARSSPARLIRKPPSRLVRLCVERRSMPSRCSSFGNERVGDQREAFDRGAEGVAVGDFPGV